MAQQRQRRYLSYLLRLWQTSDGKTQIWQASLETPGTGERQGFGSLEELFDFLEAQISQTTPQDGQGCARDKAEGV